MDPVRFLGNRSSGKQGYALARTAVARGATVQLISANVALPDPAGAQVLRVETTEQLRTATLAAARQADVVVMAAAPCDFRPAEVAREKIKKDDTGRLTLSLVATADIAAELGVAKPPGQVLVAFAAETAIGEAARDNARRKLAAKRADLIVLNEVGAGDGRADPFGADHNAATVLGTDGGATMLPAQPKEDLADRIWDLVLPLLTSG